MVNPVSTGSACAYIPPESNPCYGYTPHRTEEKENPVVLKLLQTSLLNISPNPTDGRIKIQWDSEKIGEGNKVFRIFDLRGQLLGQIILASEEDTGELNLNLSSLPQGVYFVQLVGRKEKLVGKIFKQ